MGLKSNVKKSLTFVALAVFVASGIVSCTPEKPAKEVGLQLWSVREDMKNDAKGTIEKVGAMGYKFIEAAGYSDGKFYGMDPADFKALVDTNGMTFYASHTGQAVPDSAKMESTMAWWDAAIAAHKAAGVSYIVQPFMDSVGYTTLAGVQRYCDYFNAVGEKCNAAGIRFGYHNHDGEFKELEGQIIYDYMLKNTDPAKVMFEMDLYWVTVGSKNPVDYFNAYPGRFELWHVKDKAEVGGAGTVIDFKPIFENAEKSGMKKFIVEVEEYNFTPIESVQKSLEFLQKAEYVK
ncbi:MAG: sugar phosphate isomerase/epimerase [Verrucomicrobia bacterium]|nr:sugar phosphate isomerase/epimerase [Prolixibacteraceae bacterium]